MPARYAIASSQILLVCAALACGGGTDGTTTPKNSDRPPAPQSLGWVDEGIRIRSTDFTPPVPPVDAAVIKLKDGRWRMYLGGGNTGIGMRTAISNDGLSFSTSPDAVITRGAHTIDGKNVFLIPTHPRPVLLEDGRVRLFFIGVEQIYSAICAEAGLPCTIESGERVNVSAVGRKGITGPAIARLKDGRWRMYFSSTNASGSGGIVTPEKTMIHSATSGDLLSWTLDPGVRIGPGAVLSKDSGRPAAITSADGSITVFYFRCSCVETRTDDGIWYSTSADGLTFTTETQAIPGVFSANGDFENNNDPDAQLVDGSVRVYTGGGVTEAGKPFDQNNNRIKSWRGALK